MQLAKHWCDILCISFSFFQSLQGHKVHQACRGVCSSVEAWRNCKGSAMPVTWSDSYDGSTCFSICCCLGLHSWVGSYVTPNFIINWLAVQTVVRIDRNLTVPMKAEGTVARAQVFAGKRVPTTGPQYCKRKPKTKTKLIKPIFPIMWDPGLAMPGLSPPNIFI